MVNGTHSTDDKNLRWPDDLARRLHSSAMTAMMGVLNEGIGGNRRILHDNTGLAGLTRVNRDVLSQSNAKILIFSMGTNDIGRTFFPTEKGITVEQMEWATRQVVWRAHARGMRVICATLNPYESAAYYNPVGETMRQAYNEFVRSSLAAMAPWISIAQLSIRRTPPAFCPSMIPAITFILMMPAIKRWRTPST